MTSTAGSKSACIIGEWWFMSCFQDGIHDLLNHFVRPGKEYVGLLLSLKEMGVAFETVSVGASPRVLPVKNSTLICRKYVIYGGYALSSPSPPSPRPVMETTHLITTTTAAALTNALTLPRIELT